MSSKNCYDLSYMKMYCVKCRNKTDTTDLQTVITKNEKLMLRGKCVKCYITKTRFVSKQDEDLIIF